MRTGQDEQQVLLLKQAWHSRVAFLPPSSVCVDVWHLVCRCLPSLSRPSNRGGYPGRRGYAPSIVSSRYRRSPPYRGGGRKSRLAVCERASALCVRAAHVRALCCLLQLKHTSVSFCVSVATQLLLCCWYSYRCQMHSLHIQV